jgi:hypothetical protein
MSYIEKKQKNNETYKYFIKKFSFMGSQHKINKYIGKQPFVSKESFLADNLEEISNKEFEIKKPFFPEDLSYNDKLIEDVEKKAIKINNKIESTNNTTIEAKMLEEFIYNSNNIEGSKLSKHELEKVFENKKSSYANKNEILEAQNSIKAYKYLKEEFNFSQRAIKKLYSILTKGLVMETGDKYPSSFRKTGIIVGNEATLEPNKIKSELEKILLEITKELALIKEDNLARGKLIEVVSCNFDKGETYHSLKAHQFDTELTEDTPVEFWGSLNYASRDFMTDTDKYPWMPIDISEDKDLPF